MKKWVQVNSVRLIVAGTMVLNISFVVYLGALPSGRTAATPVPQTPSVTAPVTPPPTTSAERVRITGFMGSMEWDANAAVQFAMEQTSAMLNYVLTGAAALLVFVVKLLADQREPGVVNLSKASLLGAGLLFVSSLVGGMLGQGYLPKLATSSEFNLEGELGIALLYQQLMLVAGAFVLLSATFPLFKQRRTHL